MVSVKLAQVIKVAKEAGTVVATIYNRVEDRDDLTITFKEDHSPLTEADLAAHRCIVEGLKNMTLKPQLSLISLPCLPRT